MVMGGASPINGVHLIQGIDGNVEVLMTLCIDNLCANWICASLFYRFWSMFMHSCRIYNWFVSFMNTCHFISSPTCVCGIGWDITLIELALPHSVDIKLFQVPSSPLRIFRLGSSERSLLRNLRTSFTPFVFLLYLYFGVWMETYSVLIYGSVSPLWSFSLVLGIGVVPTISFPHSV